MAPKLGVAPIQREKIIQATIRCLARDGSSGLRMKHIAREAGVSQAILHYYFTNKRTILTAALEAVTADLNRRIAKVTEDARDARTRLRAVVRACLGLAEENRNFWLVFVAFWGEMMHDAELATFNAAVYRRYRRALGQVVAEGVREQLFRNVNAKEAGGIILAIVDGISLQRMFDPKAFTLEQATRLSEEAIEHYLAKR